MAERRPGLDVTDAPRQLLAALALDGDGDPPPPSTACASATRALAELRGADAHGDTSANVISASEKIDVLTAAAPSRWKAVSRRVTARRPPIRRVRRVLRR